MPSSRRVFSPVTATPRRTVLLESSGATKTAAEDLCEPEELDREGAVARMEAFARVYTAVEAFPAPTVCVCVGNVVGRTLGMDEARALGLLHRTAPAAEAEGIAIDLAREIAPHPPEGMRRLKALFRELTGAAACVEHENAALIEWQRTGDGLPRGGLRSGRKGPRGRTRDQLYEEARNKGIRGRSKMGKDELKRAVARAK